jgi:hypothetical protein
MPALIPKLFEVISYENMTVCLKVEWWNTKKASKITLRKLLQEISERLTAIVPYVSLVARRHWRRDHQRNEHTRMRRTDSCGQLRFERSYLSVLRPGATERSGEKR